MKNIYVFIAITLLSIIQGCAVVTDHTKECTSSVTNASYTGPYKGVENNLTPEDLIQDIFCANHFKTTKYPNGFVTIFGSSHIKEFIKPNNPDAPVRKNKLYDEIKLFSRKWTAQYASKYPIMTGAGPGIMEAGSRGAMEAKGPSIGYTTYYGPSRDGGGDASKVFWKYETANGNKKGIITDGLIFTSVAMREYFMIMHSAAIVIAPGGIGTEWELFQLLEETKNHQLNPIPIYLVGDKGEYWQSFYNLLDDMIRRGTVKQGQVRKYFIHIDNPEDVYDFLRKKMNLN